MAIPPTSGQQSRDWARSDGTTPPNPLPGNPTPWPHHPPVRSGRHPSLHDRRSRTPRGLVLAGMGVALHAKPSVAAQCSLRVNHGDLTALLYLQGYAREDFVG